MAVQADSTEPLQKKSDVSLLIRSKKLCWKPIPFCQSVHEPFVCAKFTLWQERCVPLPNEQAIMELPPTKCTIILCKPEAFWHFPINQLPGSSIVFLFLKPLDPLLKIGLKLATNLQSQSTWDSWSENLLQTAKVWSGWRRWRLSATESVGKWIYGGLKCGKNFFIDTSLVGVDLVRTLV